MARTINPTILRNLMDYKGIDPALRPQMKYFNRGQTLKLNTPILVASAVLMLVYVVAIVLAGKHAFASIIVTTLGTLILGPQIEHEINRYRQHKKIWLQLLATANEVQCKLNFRYRDPIINIVPRVWSTLVSTAFHRLNNNRNAFVLNNPDLRYKCSLAGQCVDPSLDDYNHVVAEATKQVEEADANTTEPVSKRVF